MVQCIIRHLYVCEVCGVEHERYHLAKKCEESHNSQKYDGQMTNEQLSNLIHGHNLRN